MWSFVSLFDLEFMIIKLSLSWFVTIHLAPGHRPAVRPAVRMAGCCARFVEGCLRRKYLPTPGLHCTLGCRWRKFRIRSVREVKSHKIWDFDPSHRLWTQRKKKKKSVTDYTTQAWSRRWKERSAVNHRRLLTGCTLENPRRNLLDRAVCLGLTPAHYRQLIILHRPSSY